MTRATPPPPCAATHRPTALSQRCGCGTIETAPQGDGTPLRSLTRSLDSTKEGLAMNATRTRRPLDLADATDHFKARFWSKVDQRGPDECWPWMAYRKPGGYGQFVLRKGVFTTASRAALALTAGPLAANEVARHICDNPPCVNPAHLVPGTAADNANDSVRRGRANRARGEGAPSAKLTETDVSAIRSHPRQFGLYQRLAREYGVAAGTIRKIRNHALWSHVPARTNTDELCTKGHLLADDNLLEGKDPSARTRCATCAESFRVSRLAGTTSTQRKRIRVERERAA